MKVGRERSAMCLPNQVRDGLFGKKTILIFFHKYFE